ncbi:hypothetical protein J1N35_040162 [Gossypium stocksii]|uniref:Uncharacterized protein n=1 Tax=Gossypium stocksii TaxID=47602 RepID=A0A9D3UD15_9ROSI|nr:hypothetical protein J1N35_040162 [Gossypium stocksii]
MHVSSAEAARFLSISTVAIEYYCFLAIAFEPELENPKNLSVLEKMMTGTLQRMANSFDGSHQKIKCKASHERTTMRVRKPCLQSELTDLARKAKPMTQLVIQGHRSSLQGSRELIERGRVLRRPP